MDAVVSSRLVAYPIGVRLANWISQALLAALALSALLIAARRIAGGLGQSASGAELLAAALLAALLAAATRFSSTNRSHDRVALRPSSWLPTAMVIVFLAALSLPGTPRAALVGAWCIVAVEETCTWSWLLTRGPDRNRIVAKLGRPFSEGNVQESLLAAEPPLAVSHVELLTPLLPPTEHHDASEIIQQSTRSRTSDGKDRLSGWLQMSLAIGERNATAHVGFCPPFAAVPKISLRQMSGPTGRIRAVQILPHGVRLELKLDHSPRHPQRVSVEFIAETRS